MTVGGSEKVIRKTREQTEEPTGREGRLLT